MRNFAIICLCSLLAFVIISTAKKMDQLQSESIKKFEAMSVTNPSLIDTIQWKSNPGTTFVPFKSKDTVSINLSGFISDKNEGEFKYIIIKQIK